MENYGYIPYRPVVGHTLGNLAPSEVAEACGRGLDLLSIKEASESGGVRRNSGLASKVQIYS